MKPAPAFEHLLLPERRKRRRDRRMRGDRRQSIRWGEGGDRRKRRLDRRKSQRDPWSLHRRSC